MSHRWLILAMFALCLTASAGSILADDKSDKAVPFFNGKDFDGWEGRLEFWNVKDGVITGATPDGQRLASASTDQAVKVWDARTGENLLTLKGHVSPVSSVSFSPGGQRL